jgi:hypothetical protein
VLCSHSNFEHLGLGGVRGSPCAGHHVLLQLGLPQGLMSNVGVDTGGWRELPDEFTFFRCCEHGGNGS